MTLDGTAAGLTCVWRSPTTNPAPQGDKCSTNFVSECWSQPTSNTVGICIGSGGETGWRAARCVERAACRQPGKASPPNKTRSTGLLAPRHHSDIKPSRIKSLISLIRPGEAGTIGGDFIISLGCQSGRKRTKEGMGSFLMKS